MSYVQERLAEVRKQAAAASREKEIIGTLRDERRIKTKAEKQEESLHLAQVGYVYFIESAGLVKIGFSTDVINRLSNLRVGCPVDATLVAAIPGTEDTEAYFHKMFSSMRHKGEWFRIEGLLAKMLATMPSSVAIPERKPKRSEIVL